MSAPLATALPAVEEAREPAWVRHGSASVRGDYRTALAFEAVLVEQLTRSLAQAGGLDGEGDPTQDGEDQATGGQTAIGPLSSLLPQALAEGVVAGGGLGLAGELTRQLEGVHGAGTQRSGGTPA
jgi:Rod binding domain-containing protein